MRPIIWIASLAWLVLAGCETRQPIATTPTLAPPIAATPPAPVAPAVPHRDTVDSMRPYRGAPFETQTDTLVRLGAHHYWLRMRQMADSTKPLEYAPAMLAGKYFAAPSDTAWRAHRVRGYEATCTFTRLGAPGRGIY